MQLNESEKDEEVNSIFELMVKFYEFTRAHRLRLYIQVESRAETWNAFRQVGIDDQGKYKENHRILTRNSEQVDKLLEYDIWASRLLMNYLPYLSGEGLEGAVRLLSHITNAQDIWLSRISDHVISGGVWDSFDVAALITRIEYLNTLWRKESGRLDSVPEEVLTYTTMEGDEHRSTLSDVFSHVINHGTHHRGQVSRIIRESGIAPPPTDYIFYCRQEAEVN